MNCYKQKSEMKNIFELFSQYISKVSTFWLLRDYYFHSFFNRQFRDKRRLIESFDENEIKRIFGAMDFEERALPGFATVKENGWFRFMYERYLMTLRYTKGKTVLDSCCGLGWGSYILNLNSKLVMGVDNDSGSIKFASDVWKSPNINFIEKDIFEFFKTNKIIFDVILAMETIEHFTKEDGRKFLEGVISSLNPDGIFIGSSFFPKTQKQADELLAKNPYHLHLYAKDEIKELLNEYFKNVRIYSELFFFASKKK